MPQMTEDHRLSDLGLHQVALIWTRTGCRAERVAVDYGEDLMIQTQIGNLVEPFRIWVQVKAISRLKQLKRGHHSVRIKVEHLEKWVRTIDPVFICIFEVRRQRTFIVDPSSQLGLWETVSASVASKRTINLKFSTKDLLTPETAALYLWKARISYYSALLGRLDGRRLGMPEEMLRALPKGTATALRNSDRKLQTERMAVAFSFLNAVKLFRGNYLDPTFVRTAQNAAAHMCSQPITGPFAADCLHEAVSFCTIGFISEKTGVNGLPANLWFACSDSVWMYIQYSEPRVWERLQRIKAAVRPTDRYLSCRRVDLPLEDIRRGTLRADSRPS